VTGHRPGEIVLVAFPFSDARGVRRRPALILLDTGDADVVVARITSQLYTEAPDVTLRDWRQAGLLTPSVARLHKLATIEKRLVERSLGALAPGDWETVRLRFRQVWSAL
jgi:mRNA interferase MazF